MILLGTVEAEYFIQKGRKRRNECTRASIGGCGETFLWNLVSDGDEGHGRTERCDRIFPFYLPVPRGQSISLLYYTVNILKRPEKFCRRDKRRHKIACVLCVGIPSVSKRNALKVIYTSQMFKMQSPKFSDRIF